MIVVTGASGRLGRLVVSQLIARGVAAGDIVATVRNPARAVALSDLDVRIRHAEYTDPDSLRTAFAGADRILLISSDSARNRFNEHRNVVTAAVNADVELFAYTSMLRADQSGIGLAIDHRRTEQAVAAAGLPAVILRNGWYLENYTDNLATDLATGVHLGSAGDGRVAAASRRDYAEAAAVVLSGDGHAGAVYELAGDLGFTMNELATEVTRVSGKPVIYSDLSSSEHVKRLVDAGVPESAAELYADWDAGIARGDLDVVGPQLHRLIGRDTTRLSEAISSVLV
ncbi:NAD(P)H dehydrogenase (quinone) [Stackebrandtia albiflava]|uniref:NAD(P)H dehydrogenase (Quinone) n=1 Tax=Stackebrandtia albiflava TaxID=406432 RepID=A0A562V2E8_9ACTN|nr:SDR family oxidoreductase [Stackebrandtia albiflava]TWJ12069.1 NAD(P)H dehydrogenase (quinone) [Stackebrandtia albiflava]